MEQGWCTGYGALSFQAAVSSSRCSGRRVSHPAGDMISSQSDGNEDKRSRFRRGVDTVGGTVYIQGISVFVPGPLRVVYAVMNV